MKKAINFLAAFVFVLLFYLNSAFAFSLLGAETLSLGERGFRVGAGFPEIHAAYHIPIAYNFEVNPKFSFFYGSDTKVPAVGDKLGVEIKVRIIDSGNFNLAILVEPAFVIVYHPSIVMGLQIGGPGMITSYRFQGKYYFFGGIQIPFGFIFYTKGPASNFIASIPIMFKMGGEFQVALNINMFLAMDFGPDILVASEGSATEFRPIVSMGISMKL